MLNTDFAAGAAGRRAAWVAALMMTAASAALIPVHAAQAQTSAEAAQRRFDIPAQPLTEALIQFGRQSGLQASVDPALVRNLRGASVQGSMTSTQALGALLAGTGLTWRINGSMVTLEPAPQASGGAIALGAVRVEGASDTGTSSGLGVTEGTQSYTTPSVSIGKSQRSMREIPQPVSVVTRQVLDDRNINDLETLMRNMTGVTVDYTDSERVSYYARGFALDNIQVDGATTTPGTAGGSFVQTDSAVLDHAEILRGASGLLRGSGNPSGLVNLVRKRPLNHFALTTALQAGSWGTYRVEADVTGPILKEANLRGRLVLALQNKDFFQKGRTEDKRVAYGVLEADITPSTTVSGGIEYSEVYASGAWGNLPAGLDGKPLPLGRSTYLGMDWNRWDRWNASFFGDVTHDFGGGWKATLKANHTRMETFEGGFKQTYMVVTPAYNNPYLMDVQVSRCDNTGSTQNAFNAVIDGVVKLFGRSHEVTFGAESVDVRGVSTSPCNFATELFRYDIRNWDPQTSLPEPARSPVWTSRAVNDTSQQGVYGSSRIKVTDKLTAIVGGRFSWWDYKSRLTPTSNYSVSGEFTPYYGLVYDISDIFSAYGSYTEIFSPQNALDKNGDLLKPITGESYEAGLKSEFFGGRLTGRAALFRTELVGKALSDESSPNPCTPWYATGYCRIAAGESRSQGYELEMSGEVTPGWNVNAGYTYTETKYVTDTAANLGRPLRTVDPKHLVKVFTTYKLDKLVDGLTVGGGVTYQTRIFATSGSGASLKVAEQRKYALVNLMASYDLTKQTQLQLNINNLFDKTYYTKVAATGINYYYGEPYNVSLTLRMKLR